jgi:hypothetical protein
MKDFLHVHTICYNEIKLLPHFLRHYSFADHIYVHDNFSDDGSREYLKDMPNVTVVDYDSGGELRDDLHLQRKNNDWKASRGKAEWVIVCDVDEFVYSPILIEELQSFPNDVAMVHPEGFQMVSGRFENTDNLLVDEHQMGYAEDLYSKICLFRPELVKDTNYLPGCHQCEPIHDGRLIKSEIKLLHYSHLGQKETWNRILLRRNRLSEINIKNRWGVTRYTVKKSGFNADFKKMIKKSTNVINPDTSQEVQKTVYGSIKNLLLQIPR